MYIRLIVLGIKVVVDDSQEKKYYQESETRRKKSTVQENEEEKRKTALLRAQLQERYATLKSSYDKELQARKTNDELQIKEAVKNRIARTRELDLYLQQVRQVNRLVFEDVKQTNRLEILDYKRKISEIRSAPKTNLNGVIGSESCVRHLQFLSMIHF